MNEHINKDREINILSKKKQWMKWNDKNIGMNKGQNEWMNEWANSLHNAVHLHIWLFLQWCSSIHFVRKSHDWRFQHSALKTGVGMKALENAGWVCQWKSFCAQYDLSVSLMCSLQFFPIYFNNEIIQSPQCLLKMKRWYASACEPALRVDKFQITVFRGALNEWKLVP